MAVLRSDIDELRDVIAGIQREFPLRILGVLPPGTIPHVADPRSIELLAKKSGDLSLLALARAERVLSERLGRPVGVVLTSEYHGAEAARVTEAARAL